MGIDWNALASIVDFSTPGTRCYQVLQPNPRKDRDVSCPLHPPIAPTKSSANLPSPGALPPRPSPPSSSQTGHYRLLSASWSTWQAHGSTMSPSISEALPATRRGRAAHPILALHPSRGLFQCILEAADCLAFVLGGRPERWFRATFQRFSEATRHVALLLTCDWGCCGLVLH